MQSDPSSDPAILALAQELQMTPAAVSAARAQSPEQLEQMVENYLYRDSHSAPCPYAQAIKPVRDLVTTRLLEELAKPDAFSDSSIFCPAAKAAKMLRDTNNQEAKNILLQWVASGTENAFKAIGSTLVSYGSDDLIPTISVLLEHPKDFPIASSARQGVLEAAKNGRVEPLFKDSVWNYCVRLFQSDTPPSMYDPLRLMLALDEEGVVQILSSPEYLRSDHPRIHSTIGTLLKLGQLPPVDLILDWISTLPKNAPQRLTAIRGLHQHGHPDTLMHLEALFSRRVGCDEDVLLTAWDLRFEIAGVSAPHNVAKHAYENEDTPFEQLSQLHQDFILIDHVSFMSAQSGLDIFFSDPLGAHPGRAIEALKRVGAKKHAALFSKLVKLYRKGPYGDQGLVLDYLEELGEDKIQALEEKLADLRDPALVAVEWAWKQRKG